MRFIDTSSIVPPNNWVTIARRSFNPLWSYFKEDFEKIVGKKCWYSECDNSGASNPIDHYRPKAVTIRELTDKNADLEVAVWGLIDCKERPGYPFLELDFSNYRYSCDYANSLRKGSTVKSKGKSNFFPLMNGSSYGNDKATINNELVCLLDPCIQNDPELLYFTSTGFIEPSKKISTHSLDYCRVKVSIEIYHLHYHNWVDKRSTFWNSCKDHIEIIGLLYGKTGKSFEDSVNMAYHINELKKKILKSQPFSAVAIDCIRHFKENYSYPWMEHHFPDAILIK